VYTTGVEVMWICLGLMPSCGNSKNKGPMMSFLIVFISSAVKHVAANGGPNALALAVAEANGNPSF